MTWYTCHGSSHQHVSVPDPALPLIWPSETGREILEPLPYQTSRGDHATTVETAIHDNNPVSDTSSDLRANCDQSSEATPQRPQEMGLSFDWFPCHSASTETAEESVEPRLPSHSTRYFHIDPRRPRRKRRKTNSDGACKPSKKKDFKTSQGVEDWQPPPSLVEISQPGYSNDITIKDGQVLSQREFISRKHCGSQLCNSFDEICPVRTSLMHPEESAPFRFEVYEVREPENDEIRGTSDALDGLIRDPRSSESTENVFDSLESAPPDQMNLLEIRAKTPISPEEDRNMGIEVHVTHDSDENEPQVPLTKAKMRKIPKPIRPKPEFSIDKSDWQLPIQLNKIGNNPPIHSETRQEICETLPYFRSFQGGHYTSKGRTLSYLLDGTPSPRDVFEDQGRIIISHGGGGSKVMTGTEIAQKASHANTSTKNSHKKRIVFCKSQSRSGFRVQSLLNCMNHHIPVVLLAGKKYSMMPWLKERDDIGYVVLGHYLVTHSWAEKEVDSDFPGRICVRMKFRFQWISSQGDPWWLCDIEKHERNVIVALENQPIFPLHKPCQAASSEIPISETKDPAKSTEPLTICFSLELRPHGPNCLDGGKEAEKLTPSQSWENMGTEELLALPLPHAGEPDITTSAPHLHVKITKRMSCVLHDIATNSELYNPSLQSIYEKLVLDAVRHALGRAGISLCVTVPGKFQIHNINFVLSSHIDPKLHQQHHILSNSTSFSNPQSQKLTTSLQSSFALVATHKAVIARNSPPETLLHNRFCSSENFRSVYFEILVLPSSIAPENPFAGVASEEKLGATLEVEPIHQICKACGIESPHLYLQRWLCLNEICQEFFESQNKNTLGEDQDLTYMPWVLKFQAGLEKEERVPQQLQPPSIQSLDDKETSRTLNQDMRRGIYCSDCGRMSCRTYWGTLRCNNAACHFEVKLEVNQIYSSFDLPQTCQNISKSFVSEAYFEVLSIFPMSTFTVHVYKVCDGSGYIVHAVYDPGDSGTQGTSDVDEIFHSYQQEIKPHEFKRNAFRRTYLSHARLAQQFTLNCGTTYKFCAEVDTIPWSQSPRPVVDALKQLHTFMDEFNKQAPRLIGYALSITFNEILSCCYLPGTGMNFHADDEIGVGPLVASLSLGSAALMSFKPKPIKVKTEKSADKTSSEQPHGTDSPETKQTSARTAMTLLLKHGDIVLQVGPGLQRDWLHAVETDGFRIAATARNIRSDNIKT